MTTTIVMRRMDKIRLGVKLNCLSFCRVMRNQTGITTSFETMMLNASNAIMTILVAADKPPIKAIRVISGLSIISGMASRKVSCPACSGARCNALNASGSMKKLIANRYSGKAQRAVFNSSGWVFST